MNYGAMAAFGNQSHAYGAGSMTYGFGTGRRGRIAARPSGQMNEEVVVATYVDPNTGDLIEEVETRPPFLKSTAGQVTVGLVGLAAAIGITYFAAKAGAKASRSR